MKKDNDNQWFQNTIILIIMALIVLFVLASLLLVELSVVLGNFAAIFIILLTDALLGYISWQLYQVIKKN